MATATIKPNGTIASGWDTATEGTHHESIDEGTDAPEVTEYIETSGAGDVDTFDLEASPAALQTLTQVTVNVHGYLDDDSSEAQLQVNVTLANDTDITGSPIYMDGSGLPGNFSEYGTTPETVSVTLTGLSLNKTEADGLRVSTKLLDS